MALVACECIVFLFAWRLGVFLEPSSDPRGAALFLALGTILTIQAMVMVGMAWMLVAVSRTRVEFGPGGLSLEHPWRRWSGGWHELSRAWHQRGWLTLQLKGHVRSWHVRAAESDPLVAELQQHLPRGVWLEGARLRGHLVRRILPLVVAAALVGSVLLWVSLRLIASMTPGT